MPLKQIIAMYISIYLNLYVLPLISRGSSAHTSYTNIWPSWGHIAAAWSHPSWGGEGERKYWRRKSLETKRRIKKNKKADNKEREEKQENYEVKEKEEEEA